MISILRLIRLINKMIILDQFRIPLIGFATNESIEAIIAETKRPSFFRSAYAECIDRYIMILTNPECTPSCIAEYTCNGTILQWYMAVITRETGCCFGNSSETIVMMITSRKKT